MAKPTPPALPEFVSSPAGGVWPEAGPDGGETTLKAGDTYARAEALSDEWAEKLINAGHVQAAEAVPATPAPTSEEN